jgi:hypothetical protein
MRKWVIVGQVLLASLSWLRCTTNSSEEAMITPKLEMQSQFLLKIRLFLKIV